MILEIMGNGWNPEVSIKTNVPKSDGYYPTNYKVDLGHTECKLAIEIDGKSHYGKGKAADVKKDNFLQDVMDWRVLRIKNAKAIKMYKAWKETGLIPSELKEFKCLSYKQIY